MFLDRSRSLSDVDRFCNSLSTGGAKRSGARRALVKGLAGLPQMVPFRLPITPLALMTL